MATVPRSGEFKVPGAGREISTRPVGRVSLRPVIDVISDITKQSATKAAKAAADRAIIEQTGAGASTLLTADPSLDTAAAEAYNKQARVINSKQATAAAQLEALRLADQFRGDPEGFADAYATYRDQVVDQYTDADPVHGALVSHDLDAVGQRVALNLIAEKQNTDRASSQADYLATLDSQTQDLQRAMLGRPDEETMLSGLADLATSIAVAATDEGGMLLTPQQTRPEQNRRINAVVETYVNSVADKAFDRGDTGAIRALISKLDAGAWYPDPNDARAAKMQLLTRLKSMQTGTADTRDRLGEVGLETLKKFRSIAEAGGAIDPGAVAKQLDATLPYLTPAKQADAVQNAYASLAVAQQAQQIDSMTAAQLDATIDALDTQGPAVSELDNEALKLLRSRAEKRAELIRQSSSPATAWDVAPQNLIIGVTPPQEFGKQRRMAASVTGVSPDLMPLYPPQAVARAAEEFDAAIRSRRVGGAVQILDSMLAGAEGNPGAAWSAAAQARGLGTPLYVAAVAKLVDPTGRTTQQLVQLASAGGDPGAREAAGIEGVVDVTSKLSSRFFGTSDWVRMSSALTQGDPGMAADVMSFAGRVYVGAQIQAKLTGEDGDDVFRAAFAPLVAATTKVGGNQYVFAPRLGISTKNGQSLLDRIKALRESGDLPDTAVPVDFGAGAVGFVDSAIRAPVLREDGSPVLVDAPAVVRQDLATQNADALITSTRSSAGQQLANSDVLVRAATGAALETKFKLPTGIMDALHAASRATPPAHLSGRMAQQPVSEMSARALRGTLTEYGDLETAVTAYAMGDLAFSQLRKQAGDQWRKYVPQATAEYVGRVMDTHERQE